MKSSFRWYGDSDPVTLDKIRQIPGMRSIVSAVYDVKPGNMAGEISYLVDECREHGLIFDVVESIPVTEEIKLGRPERDRHIENYCECSAWNDDPSDDHRSYGICDPQCA